MESKPILNTHEAARMLGVRSATLNAWRIRGTGPPFVAISNKCVRYRVDDVVRWLEERSVNSTAEASARGLR